MKRSTLMLAILILLFISSGVALVVSSEVPSHFSGTEQWVPEEECNACHEPQHQSWLGSHHQLAMQPASERSVLGDFNNHIFTGQRARTQFNRKSDGFWISTPDADGKVVEHPVAYTLGLEPLQQYLLKMPDGRLQAFDVAWNTKEKRWYELYPGQAIQPGDALHWSGINQNANFMCIECHATGYTRNFNSEKDQYASTWQMPGVGCQSCHGPASGHLEWTKIPDEISGRGFSASGINAAKEREVEVCARCHSRRSALRDGYQHSAQLMDDYLPAALSPVLYEIDGKIKDEVFEYASFMQSRMYEAGVRCTTCHDPHTTKLRLSGNALCTQCHNPSGQTPRLDINTSGLQAKNYDSSEHHQHKQQSAAAQCISCHMPARNFMVTDQRHDHSFSIPNPSQAQALGHSDACISCHQDVPKEQLVGQYKAQFKGAEQHDGGYASALHKARYGQPGAAEAIVTQLNRTDLPAMRKATLLAELHQYPSAQTQKVAVQALYDSSPQVREAAISSLETLANAKEKLQWISPLLSDPVRAVRMAAAWQLASADAGLTSHTDSFRKALKEYEDSQLSLLERPESYLNLAMLYQLTNRYTLVEPTLGMALKRDKNYQPAQILLAQWIEQQGDDRAARQLLENAIEQTPQAADLYNALAMQLVRNGQRDPALDRLKKAYELTRDTGRYAYAYAIGLYGTGMQNQSIAILDAHLAKHPADRAVRKALLTYAQQSGDTKKIQSLLHSLRMINPGDPLLR